MIHKVIHKKTEYQTDTSYGNFQLQVFLKHLKFTIESNDLCVFHCFAKLNKAMRIVQIKGKSKKASYIVHCSILVRESGKKIFAISCSNWLF